MKKSGEFKKVEDLDFLGGESEGDEFEGTYLPVIEPDIEGEYVQWRNDVAIRIGLRVPPEEIEAPRRGEEKTQNAPEGIAPRPTPWIRSRRPGASKSSNILTLFTIDDEIAEEAILLASPVKLAWDLKTTGEETIRVKFAACLMKNPAKLSELLPLLDGKSLLDLTRLISLKPNKEVAQIMMGVSGKTIERKGKESTTSGDIFAEALIQYKSANDRIGLARESAICLINDPKQEEGNLNRGTSTGMKLQVKMCEAFGESLMKPFEARIISLCKDIPEGATLDPQKVISELTQNPKFQKGKFEFESQYKERLDTEASLITNQTAKLVGKLMQELLNLITRSPISPELAAITATYYDAATERFNEKSGKKQAGSFLFLRVINPALANLRLKLQKNFPKTNKSGEGDKPGNGDDMSSVLGHIQECIQFTASGIRFTKSSKKPFLIVLEDYEPKVMEAIDTYITRAVEEGKVWCKMLDQGLDLCNAKDVLFQAMNNSLVLGALFQLPTPEDALGTRPVPGYGQTTILLAKNRDEKSMKPQSFERMIAERPGDNQKLSSQHRMKLVEKVYNSL